MSGDRLSGLDGAFLALESATSHLHVVGVLVLDADDVPPEVAFRRIRARIAERLVAVPPFGQRVAPAPLGLAQPVLEEAGPVELDYHVRRAGLPRPGGRRELEALVADVASRPLDRRRPLWEMHVVEGLADGGVAVVAKVHHAIIDGVAGAELLATFLDLEPAPRAAAVTRIDVARTATAAGRSESAGSPHRDPSASGTGAPDPGDPDAAASRTAPWSDLEPWLGLLGSLPAQVDGTLRTLGRTLRRLGVVARERREHRDVHRPPLPFAAPPTSLNRAISSYRRVAFGDLDMVDVRRIREVLGGTTNDVVLAAVTGSLRRFFAARAESPGPLVAMVPVSIRTPSESGDLGNRLSALLVTLPVDVPDPIERLETVRASANAAKVRGADGALVQGWAEATLPAVTTRVAQLATAHRIFDHVRPVFNLVVSNVPGPDVPLYLAGFRLRSMHPFGPVTEGTAVNVTVVSYLDRIHVGVQACWDIVPDIEVIVRGVEDSLAELVRAADRRDRPVPWWHAEVLPA